MILIIIGALLLSTLYPLFADASRKIVISIEEKEPNAILTFSLVAILVFIGRSIVQLMNGYLMTLFGGKVCLDIQSDLINHINSVPYEYFQKNHSGDIIARLLNDVQGIGGVLSYSGISLIQIPLNATASIIYGLTLSPIMTIGLMLIGPIPLVFNKIFGDRLRALANEARKVWAGIYGLTTDILKGSDVVKAYDIANPLLKKIQSRYDEELQIATKQTIISQGIAAGASIFGQLTFIFPCVIGTLLIINGSARVGDVVAFITLVPQITEPFFALPNLIAGVQQGAAAGERVQEVFDVELEQWGKKDLIEFNHFESEKISFEYNKDTSDSVLAVSDVSLRIGKGQKVAFVGHSGSGKSTFVKVLLGLYRPTRGSIKVNGEDLFSYTKSSVNESFAYVPQETILFTGTMADNILLGAKHASKERFEQALEIGLVDEFLSELPGGLDYNIGQDGGLISGGQRQRLGIARAIYKGAPVMVLDEATSELDLATERRIIEGLTKLPTIETIIMVTHRLRSIMDFDQIYVFVDGKIAEYGTHQVLLKNNGAYAEMFYRQKDGDESDSAAEAVLG